jgi:hypothetical protein
MQSANHTKRIMLLSTIYSKFGHKDLHQEFVILFRSG